MKKHTIQILMLLLLTQATVVWGESRSNQPDRQYWVGIMSKIAKPVLEPMSRGELHKTMKLELSPTWDGRNKRVAYMEAFGRLISGIAPWLALPDDDSEEGRLRKQYRQWALKCYANAVDSTSGDYLLWNEGGQPLVDAAYIANSFLRAPKQLWEPLDAVTKERYIKLFQSLRRVNPPYTNWLLFSAMVETFLYSVNEQYDAYRIQSALRKIEEWYIGDGFYSDGQHFAFDYYNSFVIQPMFIEVMEALLAKKNSMVNASQLEVAYKRMQRYGIILERFISPEASFPVFGRSITYRMGAFHPLSLLALRKKLPAELAEGMVRNALTQVMKRMYANPENFSKEGYLQLGFCGHQPNIADWYTNNGSLYITSLVFTSLGLPADDSFWVSVPEKWTSLKAWSGEEFPKDHAFK